jgi:uncharacterized protein
MRDLRNAKVMAQTLRAVLKTKSITVTNSESLELIARILGFHDWNVLSARIQADPDQRPIRFPPVPLPAGADLPLVPLRDLVLFPDMIAPIFVGREKTKRALDCAMAVDRRILAVTQRQPGDDDPSQETLYSVGVVARVVDFSSLDEGPIMVRCLKRARLTRVADGEMLAANVAPFVETRGDATEAETLARTTLERLRAYLNVDFTLQPYSGLPRIRKPAMLADAIAPLLPIDIGLRQQLLETANAVARLNRILALIESDRGAT